MNSIHHIKNHSDRSGTRKIFQYLRFAAVLFPSLVGVPLFNIIIDSADKLPWIKNPIQNEQLKPYDRDVLHDLVNEGVHSVRLVISRPLLWKWLVKNGLWNPDKIQTVYLGSSLGMPINSEMVGEGLNPVSFINASVTASSIRDHIISFEILNGIGIKPGRVILELDAWSLVEPKGAVHNDLQFYGRDILQDLNVTSEEEYEKMIKKSNESKWDQLLLTFSPSYFQFNLEIVSNNLKQNFWLVQAIRKQEGPVQEYTYLDIPEQERILLFPDLSMRWSPEKISRTEERVREINSGRSNTPNIRKDQISA